MSDHTTLVEGQRLDQPTFHALYEAMPPGTRAELINGVVFMPSPVGSAHGIAHVPVIVWLDYYAENTPGVQVLDNATTILGWKSEPQPDAMLRILPECGGQTRDERDSSKAILSWSSRSPRRPGTSTWGQSWPTTNRPAFSSMSFMLWIPTKWSGSSRIRCSEHEGRSPAMESIGRRCFRASGSTRCALEW